MDEPWAENVMRISDQYEEVYPSGKKNYEMIHFGPVAETRFLYIPKDVDIDKYILES